MRSFVQPKLPEAGYGRVVSPFRRAVLVGCLTLAVGSTVGCLHMGGGDSIRGSGTTVTETRDVPPFERIDLHGSGRVEVTVGSAQRVEVTTDDNVIGRLLTEVEDDTLVIRLSRGSYRHVDGPHVTITVPELRGVSIRGSGEVRATDIRAPSFRASISGSGDMQLHGGVGRLHASISGSGDMHLSRLRAREAVVKIAGSGDMRLTVLESLSGKIAGSGDVRVHGSPQLHDWKTAGSGDLHIED